MGDRKGMQTTACEGKGYEIIGIINLDLSDGG